MKRAELTHRIVQGIASSVVALALGVTSTNIVLADEEPRQGGTLRIGLEADFNTLDIPDMGALVERMVSTSIYETLLDLDENGELVPMLATSYSSNSDATVYTVTLREGVSFHDGTPFNADAVARNFNRLLDPDVNCRCAAEIRSLEEVVVTSEYELEFHLNQSNASFPAVLADVAGMQPSPTAVEDLGDRYATNPVGTGPFVFKSWTRGGTFRVERNENYWQDGYPHLDAVTYRPIPDQQTRLSSLAAGDIDISAVPASTDVARLRSEGRHADRLKVQEAPGLGTIFTMLNVNREPLDDLRVRRALFHATDRAVLNEALNRGIHGLVSNPFGPGMWGGELTTEFPAFDQEKARSLLEDYGKPVEFTLAVSAVPVSIRAAEILQQMWGQVGVNVSIDQQEQRTLIGNAINNNFDAMYFRWPGRGDPDLNSYQFFHSESPRNYTRYSNPEMDDLLERARSETDHEKRADLYREVAAILADGGPYLFKWDTTQFFMMRKEVNGLPSSPDGLPRVRTVWLER